MSEPQLNLLGDHAQPVDEQLGPVQRAVARLMRQHGSITRDEAGAVAHAHRGRHPADQRCMWCGVDGDPILHSLIRRGLAEKGVEGAIRPARPCPDQRHTDPDADPFPEGY